MRKAAGNDLTGYDLARTLSVTDKRGRERSAASLNPRALTELCRRPWVKPDHVELQTPQPLNF